MSKKRKKICDAIRIECYVEEPEGAPGSPAYTECVAVRGRRQVGSIRFEDLPGREHLQINYIEVDEDVQRCGLGTRLYEKAAELAREEGRPLRSDAVRSPAAEGFWEKQVRKGRARHIPTTPSGEPGPTHFDFYELYADAVDLGDAVDLEARRALDPAMRGFGYIPRNNPCGLSYKDFRSPWEFKDAFEMLGGRGGAKYRPSRRRVIGMLGKLKREEYERYLEACAAQPEFQPPYAGRNDPPVDPEEFGFSEDWEEVWE